MAHRDMLAVADAVARERAIDREEVIEAIELALQKAGRSRYGADHDIRARIDRDTGAVSLTRHVEVVETPEDVATQCSLEEARARKPDAALGDSLTEALPPLDFGRVAALTARQVMVQQVREAERARQYQEYKDRVGEVVTGIVKRVEYGNVTLDLGRAEAVLRRDEIIPREHHRRGDRVRAYIHDVREEQRGPQIFLSRTHPEFMKRLFAQEVPEVYDGIIDIISVARDPGSRAKISVTSHDSSIDPVGACVGMRGSRVQAVVGELQGERVDIIQWTPDNATYVVNALAPAEVTKVVMDEDNRKMEVVVPDEQLSIAIGRRGQNVRLASILTGWSIDIMTEDDEATRRQNEANERSQTFMEALDVDDVIARLLVTEGFTTVEDVAYVPLEELASIQGFDEGIAGELQLRATTFLEAEAKRLEETRRALGVTDAVAALEELTPPMLVALGEAEVKTLEDFAGLAADELTSPEDGLLRTFDMTEEDASDLVMRARVSVGWMTEEELEAYHAAQAEEEDTEEGEETEGGETDDDAAPVPDIFAAQDSDENDG